MNAYAVEELIGHCVNYRKVLDRDGIKDDDIRLYAVTTRWPRKLFSMTAPLELMPGVWELHVLSRFIRVIVVPSLPLEQRNAILAFFSFDAEKVRFALEHYEWQMEDGSTVINQLLNKYRLEGIAMPYTIEQFRKDYVKAYLSEMDPEEVLSRFAPEDRLKGLDPEDRLKGLDPEDVLARFDPEDRLRGLDPEDRLKGLDPKEIEAYLKKLKKRH